MIRNVFIESWSEELSKNRSYDLFIATVGYENRARYIAESRTPHAKRKIAYAFSENNQLDYRKNMQYYKKGKYDIVTSSEMEFYRWSNDIVNELLVDNEKISILIDISSMTRYRIASLIWALSSATGNKPICADFIYSLALFNPPPSRTGPITNIGPILSEFAGWHEEPNSRCVAIIGLGYDLGKAVGTIEYVEPGEIWAMNPIGEDKRYEEAVMRSNKLLLDSIKPDKIIDYNITNPYETYYRLESLISGAIKSARPLIIPFGPKIFTLCALISAIVQYPKLSVWRVSSGKYEQVKNRIPSGTVVGLRANFIK